MDEPLTPSEEAVLRGLEEEIAREDAELASRLRAMATPSAPAPLWARCSVRCSLQIGCVLVLVGGMLEVDSSAVTGLMICAGAIRSGPGRRLVRDIRAGFLDWWRTFA